MAHGRCSPAEYSRTVLEKISAAARSTSVLARSRPLPRAPLCWHRGTCVPKPMRDDCSRCGIGVSGWHGPRSRWRADRNTRAGPACKRADRRIPEAARGLCMGAGYRRQSQGGLDPTITLKPPVRRCHLVGAMQLILRTRSELCRDRAFLVFL